MEKLRKFLMQNYSFPLLTALLGAATFTGGHMLLTHNFGLMNEIAQAEMLRQGMSSGDWAAPIGYASGFLLARIMEGPLVGILDIGGSFGTGVGTGLVAVCMATGLDFLVLNFPLAILTGFLIGLVIGIIIIAVKKAMPQGMAASGTNIMMGVGNATGRYLGPLVILSAISYSIPAGIGAVIGATIFYKLDKAIVGGAILGAMFLAFLFPIPA
jgi:uncharacterized protein (TIGR03579 family)